MILAGQSVTSLSDSLEKESKNQSWKQESKLELAIEN